jgi:chromosome segregation ATPase
VDADVWHFRTSDGREVDHFSTRGTIPAMADDIEKLLERFRNDIVSHVESSEGKVREELRGVRDEIGGLRREMFTHFDEIYARFDRLETEYQSLSAAVARLEAKSLSRAEFEREIEQLRGRISHLQHRLDELEKTQREN